MMTLPSSSPSSSCTSERKYHVFLSFRGEDTRDNFTSHLYATLCRKKIRTFIDNDLHRGDEISDSLLKAIEESEIAIVLFSKGYATSRWCLEELAKILECKKLLDLIVIPVFYRVDPSDVRNQKGIFGEAFVKHEERFPQSLEKVQRWRAALTEAANLSGFDSNVIRPEAVLIEEIIKDILKRLNHMSPSYNKDLVGVESSITEIELLLGLESNDVRIIGLWGMGGIGKTTLARALYNKISSQFESHHFVNDVREQSEKHELTRLRQELLSVILDDDKCAYLESIFTKSRLRNKKILIVFDDVTFEGQIEKLVGDLEYHYGPGSRIFITSRDKQVLKNCGVSSYNIYEVKELLDDSALQLFSRHAFKLNHPTVDYMEVSQKIVRFAKGVPLALKVLGGLLFGKTIEEWESAMHKLERNPDSKIMDVLKISFEGLEEGEKTIFLDIACFFERAHKNLVMDFFDANGLDSKFQVGNLDDKSLISITDGMITMHDLLKEMGKKIVNEKSNEPGERSRLWHHEDIYHVLKKNTGTKEIEGICLNMSKIKDVNLKRSTFLNLHKLRVFNFCCCCNLTCSQFQFCYPFCSLKQGSKNKVHAPQGLEFGCAEPSYFHWFGYPLKSLPTNFDPENLVALSLPYSNVEQILNVVQPFDKLKYIDLRYSKQLTRTPDLSFTPNLESLILQGCTNLIEVPLSSQRLNKLKFINLSFSEHLIRIPDLSLIPNLERLILERCTNLIEVPSYIQYLKKLDYLNLNGCKSLSSLPTSFQTSSVLYINLSGCSNLKRAPKITRNIKAASLDGTSMTELPAIEYPSSLTLFSFENCPRLESFPSTIWKLQTLCNLSLPGCSILSKLPNNFGSSGLSSLEILDLSNCQITKLPDSLGQLRNLEELFLNGNNFDCIPPLSELSRLDYLGVRNCKRLQFLPDLPSRAKLRLDASNCTSLEVISDSLFSKMEINLGNCFKLDQNKLKAKLGNALLEGDNRYGDILFPGNEIPECFSIQNMGSSITLEIPPDYMDKETIWIAMCVIVTFQDHNKVNIRPIHGHARCIGRDKYGKTKQLQGTDMYFYGKLPKDCYLTSDHVLVGYNIRCLATVLNRQHIVDFDVRGGTLIFDFYGDKETNGFEVKKCGIKLLPYHDESFSSDDEEEEEEEEEQQPKRQKF